jgi:hypothetical protein
MEVRTAQQELFLSASSIPPMFYSIDSLIVFGTHVFQPSGTSGCPSTGSNRDHFLQADFTGLIPPWKPDSTPACRQTVRGRDGCAIVSAIAMLRQSWSVGALTALAFVPIVGKTERSCCNKQLELSGTGATRRVEWESATAGECSSSSFLCVGSGTPRCDRSVRRPTSQPR